MNTCMALENRESQLHKCSIIIFDSILCNTASNQNALSMLTGKCYHPAFHMIILALADTVHIALKMMYLDINMKWLCMKNHCSSIGGGSVVSKVGTYMYSLTVIARDTK